MSTYHHHHHWLSDNHKNQLLLQVQHYLSYQQHRHQLFQMEQKQENTNQHYLICYHHQLFQGQQKEKKTNQYYLSYHHHQ